MAAVKIHGSFNEESHTAEPSSDALKTFNYGFVLNNAFAPFVIL